MTAVKYSFLRQFTGVVAATLVPVVLTTFISVPLSLGGHPGEARASGDAVAQHMT
jgi:hypothetical protein